MVALMDKMSVKSTSTIMTFVYIYILLSDKANYVNCTKQKRQLFREQVLPEKGGKIPESAFRPDRLLLNRLNQQGISVPDGLHLDQRRQEKHPFPKQNLPETLKVYHVNDGRYIAPPGKYQFFKSPTIDTTYVIRIPHTSSYKRLLYQHWDISRKTSPMQYYVHVNITKWKHPKIISNSTEKLSDEDIDPSQVLAEYSSYLQKLHERYDK